jgi:hypothetical protein
MSDDLERGRAFKSEWDDGEGALDLVLAVSLDPG